MRSAEHIAWDVHLATGEARYVELSTGQQLMLSVQFMVIGLRPLLERVEDAIGTINAMTHRPRR